MQFDIKDLLHLHTELVSAKVNKVIIERCSHVLDAIYDFKWQTNGDLYKLKNEIQVQFSSLINQLNTIDAKLDATNKLLHKIYRKFVRPSYSVVWFIAGAAMMYIFIRVPLLT